MRLTAARLTALAALLLVLCVPRESAALDITLQWDPNPPADGVLGYRVYVSTPAGGEQTFTVLGTTSFTYTNASATELYYFQVAAYNLAGEGARSARITSMVDHPLSMGTLVRAVHMTQLRTAINAVRVQNGLLPVVWTDPVIVPGSTSIKAAHVTEMRTALAQVYARQGRQQPVFPTLTPGVTPVRGTDIMAIRTALLDLP